MNSERKRFVRERKARKIRAMLREQRKVRLCVHRTPRHIYAQMLSADGATVLVSASTVEPSVREKIKNNGSNIDAAKIVGTLIGERAVQSGTTVCAFDRSGFRYHGRIKALADAARAAGLQF